MNLIRVLVSVLSISLVPGVSFAVVSVPEPASLTLLGLGLVGLGVGVIRRRRK